jgi:hypothetical protein
MNMCFKCQGAVTLVLLNFPFQLLESYKYIYQDSQLITPRIKLNKIKVLCVDYLGIYICDSKYHRMSRLKIESSKILV